MFQLDRERIERAKRLFTPGTLGQPHALVTVFECLAAELQTRAMVLKQLKPSPGILASFQQLARLFQYASFRLTELILRLEQLNWMQREFQAKRGEESAPWHNFAALAIKDFHIDLGSFMDALAPALLQATGAFDAQGQSRLPGFADVQSNGSPRASGLRGSVPRAVLDVVDGTDRWWPAVKQVRDALTHREHDKIVFGGASLGVLFQVYEPRFVPKVLDPNLLWQSGKDVADFRLYSAAVLAELLVFLEDLGTALAGNLNLSVDGLTKSMRLGDFTYLLEPMERLLATPGTPRS